MFVYMFVDGVFFVLASNTEENEVSINVSKFINACSTKHAVCSDMQKNENMECGGKMPFNIGLCGVLRMGFYEYQRFFSCGQYQYIII